MTDYKEILGRRSAFTLAEVAVVMGILAVMMAAFAPVLTKKTINPGGDKRVTFDVMSNHNGIYFGSQTDTKPVVIGDNKTDASMAFSPKLLIVGNNAKDSTKSSPQIAFASKVGDSALTYAGQLLMEPTPAGTNTDTAGNLILGGKYNQDYPIKSSTYYGNTIIGMNADTSSTSVYKATTLGTGAKAATQAVALGYSANASASAVAIGNSATATSSQSVAIGNTAKANYQASVIIGPSARNFGNYSVAIGYNPDSTTDGVSIGRNASGSTNGCVAIGTNASSGSGSVVIGYEASANSGTAIGYQAKDYSGGVAIGKYACKNSKGYYSICLGNSSGPSSSNSTSGIWLGPNTISYGASNIYFGSDTLSSLITTTTSDRRLKNVGEEFTGGIDELNKLKFYNYTFKKDDKKTPQVGVIAQDLRKVYPNAVTKDSDGFLRIRKDELFYSALNAIKDLFKRLAETIDRVKALETRNAELEKRNADLEKRIEKLEKLLVK